MNQKIGMITFHRANNLGAALQAYALYTYLNDNICPTEIIDYYPNNAIPARNTLLRRAMRVAKKTVGGKEQKARYQRFAKFDTFINECRTSEKVYYGDKEIETDPPKYDLIISGSDQILNTTLTGNSRAYYLSFAQDTPKISYASSFGRSGISATEDEYIKKFLPDFQEVSVREESGKEIVDQRLGYSSEVVVDPVFLLSKEKWRGLAQPVSTDKYIFVYAMENTPWLIEAVGQVRARYQLPVKIVLGGDFQLLIDGEVDDCCGPREFLSYIENAECVVTNSFHGTAFSIIYEKKFVCVTHSKKNTRLENLCKLIGNKPQVPEGERLGRIDDYIIAGSDAYKSLDKAIERSKRYLTQNASAVLKKDVESIIDARVCCGCGTCAQLCSQKAVSMTPDEKGFLYPKVDAAKCTQCGLCVVRCPERSEVSKAAPIHVYAARHNNPNVVKESTSGGAFTALSDYFLRTGGLVFGAALCDDFKCRHTQSDNESDRNKMRGAKYTQSEIGDCYIRAGEALKQGRKVLFSGTPCQIAGLKNYLKGRNQENLLTVDIVCHGVPSPLILRDHIKWLGEKKKRVVQYLFRSKLVGWHGLNVNIIYDDGENEVNTLDSNAFARMYFNSLITRESCLYCKYASIERTGDITISDFWTIGSCKTCFNDEKGTSCVYVNTLKGKSFFERVMQDLQVEEHSIDESLQPNLRGPTIPSKDCKEFWRDYKTRGFEYCMRKYTQGHMYFRCRRIKNAIMKRLCW